ncbi:hypothetical protein [Adhaeribacter aquaticus]|uniref:hypothetical protein n=1 Tax=Adhaeribacter aquaticus TaxID=299567 RepID=UPI00041561AE|nr:hypothetical protein [Adhaeribacter aquaticus]
MASTFRSSKKCPNCGQWSDWDQQLTDTCEHCGTLLSNEQLERAAAREADKKDRKTLDLDIIEIHPTDSVIVVFYKRIIQALQYSFIAIVTFIVWLLAFIAG